MWLLYFAYGYRFSSAICWLPILFPVTDWVFLFPSCLTWQWAQKTCRLFLLPPVTWLVRINPDSYINNGTYSPHLKFAINQDKWVLQFFKKFIYLFYFWLCCIFVTVWNFSRCRVGAILWLRACASHWGGFSYCGVGSWVLWLQWLWLPGSRPQVQ